MLCRKTTEKLVAYQGRLVSVQQTSGEASNGTAFAVTVPLSNIYYFNVTLDIIGAL